jgi:NTP pyrophosphatase (non-canonical NTP hydrolase)
MDETGSLTKRMREVRAMTDAKGFGADESRIWEMFALIHTEVSEATNAYKKGEPIDHVGEELIDAVIRILHLVSVLGLDPDELFDEKMKRNWERPYKYNTVRGG